MAAERYLFHSGVGARPDLIDEDARLALEIAEFIADRAQNFADHECRARALTDFGVWAVLAGQSPRLALEPDQPSLQENSQAL